MKAGALKASALGAWTKSRFASFAVMLALALGSNAVTAEAKTIHHSPRHVAVASYHHRYAGHITHHHYASTGHHSLHTARYYGHHHYLHYASARYSYSRLQCVPYAREVSHIQLSGDAFLWWAEAAGRYSRGATPVEGAVLNFRSIRRMPLGHVAVVTAVIDSRTILVTQANWVRGSITNDVTMQDVSPDNDWSQVQVELGDSSRWGAAYPTYGFIYNQPDGSGIPSTNTIIAAASPADSAPADATADASQGDEVAEAPKVAPISSEAPDRNLQ